MRCLGCGKETEGTMTVNGNWIAFCKECNPTYVESEPSAEEINEDEDWTNTDIVIAAEIKKKMEGLYE